MNFTKADYAIKNSDMVWFEVYLEAQTQIIGDVSQQVDDPICDQIFPIAKTIKKEICKDNQKGNKKMTFTDTDSLKYEVYEEMGVKIFCKLNYFDEQERGYKYVDIQVGEQVEDQVNWWVYIQLCLVRYEIYSGISK